MLNIGYLSEQVVVLLDDAGYTSSFSNSITERTLVQNKLNEAGCFDLWDTDILPVWTDTPLVSEVNLPVNISSLRLSKQSEIKKMCHDVIVAGISIDLGLKDADDNPLGELHYTLSEKNQTDMRDLASMITQGAKQVTWRDDSRVSHMIYTAEQFITLYNAASEYILRCRFHSDGLEELLFSYTDDQLDLILSINWDTELPTHIQTKMDNLLSVMLSTTHQ